MVCWVQRPVAVSRTEQLHQRQLEVDVGVLHGRVDEPAGDLSDLRLMWSSELRGPCVAATGADHCRVGRPVLVAAEVHPVGCRAVLAAPHDAQRLPPYATTAEVSSTDTPGCPRQRVGRPPLGLVGAAGGGVDVDRVALLPRGPQRAGGVLVDGERLALGGVDRRGIAGVERYFWLPCRSCSGTAGSGRPATAGWLSFGNWWEAMNSLRAVPEHVGVRVRTPVGEDPVVLPGLASSGRA